MSRTTITMDDHLSDQAKEYGINVSAVCREALEAELKAAKAVTKAGDGFEKILALREHRDSDEVEQVSFIGRLVHSGQGGAYYITKGGSVAVVDDDDRLQVESDPGVFDGLVHQLLMQALGHAVQPTELDI
jgi:post-segregation antitoxin (ccd killing protein)